jgi:hypothetical protein
MFIPVAEAGGNDKQYQKMRLFVYINIRENKKTSDPMLWLLVFCLF